MDKQLNTIYSWMHILFLDSGCFFHEERTLSEAEAQDFYQHKATEVKWRKSLKIARFWLFLLMVCSGRMPVCHVKCVFFQPYFRSSSSLCRAARRMAWSFLRRRAVRTSSQPGGNSSVHRMSKRPGGCSRRGTSFPGKEIYRLYEGETHEHTHPLWYSHYGNEKKDLISNQIKSNQIKSQIKITKKKKEKYLKITLKLKYLKLLKLK